MNILKKKNVNNGEGGGRVGGGGGGGVRIIRPEENQQSKGVENFFNLVGGSGRLEYRQIMC